MRYVFGILVVVFATGVLAISIVRTSQKSAYAFVVSSQERGENTTGTTQESGHLLDSVSEVVAVAGDRVRLWTANSNKERVELRLELAAERAARVDLLLDQGRVDVAIKTAVKAQRYLIEAYQIGKSEPEIYTEELHAQTYSQAVAIEEQLERLKTLATHAEMEVLNRLCEELSVVQDACLTALDL